MSRCKNIVVALVALVVGMVGASSAQAEDALCQITALAFDDGLYPQAVLGEASAPVGVGNLVKQCAKDRVAVARAAQAACQNNEDASFVAIFRRVDGVDLVNSKDSRTNVNRKPHRMTAAVRMKSCEYWLGQQ